MNNYYMDVCHSKELAEMRLAYHIEKQRKNPEMERVGAAIANEVNGQPDAPQVKNRLSADSGELWVVTAEEPAN